MGSARRDRKKQRATFEAVRTLCGAALFISVPAHAQTSAAAVELPEVVVTTPSPIAKPAKAAPKPVKKAKPAPASAASAPAPPPPDVTQATPTDEQATDISAADGDITVPGTLIVDTSAFVPVTVAREREILASSGATLTDAIQNRPGITGSTFSAGSNRPIIRGLDSYRVRVQENGLGSHDVSTISEDHAVPIDPFAADKIEVVRGPSTLRYGSGSIGGVVAAENGRIPTSLPERGVSGEVRGGLSSVDEGRDGAFKAQAGANGIAIHADGFKRSSDDYDTPRGRQLNTFSDSEGLAGGISRVFDDGFFGIAVSRVESLYGVPGEEAEEGVLPRIDLQQDKLQARGEWRVRQMGVEAVRFWFGASDYEHVELARHEEHGDGDDDHDDDHADEEEAEFEVGSRFTNREYEGRFELQHMPVATALGNVTGAAGVQIGHRKTRGQSFEGESLLEPATTRSLAAFVFEELELNSDLKLQAAGRVESTHVDGLGWSDVSDPAAPVLFNGERHFVPVSASLGLLQGLGFGIVGRLNVQYAERAPDAAELFSKGIHEATGTFEIGNPDLEKEKAVSVEIGLARSQGPLRFDATAFYTRYDGYIYRQLTGLECGGTLGSCAVPPPGGSDEETFRQVLFLQREATFVGVELAAQYDVAPIWRGMWGIDAQYDFVHAEFEGGENVPRIPPHRLGGGLYYRDANWFARAGVLHAFDQNQIGEGEIATPGYTLVSAEIGYTSELAGQPGAFTIGLKGENLADDEVLNHASFKRAEDVLLPGATVRLFGSIKFN